MQRAHSFAVFAVLLSAPVLAGCLGGNSSDVRASPLNATDSHTVDPNDIKAPDGRNQTFNGFQETNKTVNSSVDGTMHRHDYWKGRQRVDIFKGHFAMDPQPDPTGASVTILMPKGALVYEGTARVEFAVSNPERHVCEFSITFGTYYTCTDGNGNSLPAGPAAPDPAPGKLKLQYISASTTKWQDAGDLDYSKALVIPIHSPIETDMPHATTSLWQFRLLSTNPYDNTLEFDVQATIVKGEGEVPLWPPHPDFYADKHYRTVFDGPSETSESGNVGTATGFNDNVKQLQPGKLISYGTKTVEVFVNVTGFTSPSPAPNGEGTGPDVWYLYFHNATDVWQATRLFDAKNNSIDHKQLHWTLKATDDGMDSPYAPESRWEFVLRGTQALPPGAEQGVPTVDTCYGGCATYDVKYTLTVIATDLVASNYERTINA